MSLQMVLFHSFYGWEIFFIAGKFIVYRLFDDIHSDHYVRWYLSVVLIYISLIISDAEHLFFSHLSVFFGEMSISSACFLIGLFVFCYWATWVHCIFMIHPLSVTSFANIFSHSVGCLFVLFISSAVQKLFSLIRSHLVVYFCFYFHDSRKWIQKDIAWFIVKEYSAYVFL